MHTAKLKTFLVPFENLAEFKEGKDMYLVFDCTVGSALKTVYQDTYDDALIYQSQLTITCSKSTLETVE